MKFKIHSEIKILTLSQKKKLILERINAAHKFHQSKQNKQFLH